MEGSEVERAAATGRDNKRRLLSWFGAEEKTVQDVSRRGCSGLVCVPVTILSAS